METWKNIKGYEGLYQVSNEGRVRSLKFGRMKILLQASLRGYKLVGLSKDGVVKTYQVHRLVAVAFIPNPENKPQVDHINCVRDDNRAENLRWVTAQENNLNPITREKHIGRLVNREDQSIMVEQYTKSGELVRTYNSISETSKYGFCFGCVSKCVKGKRRTHKGYVWVKKKKEEVTYAESENTICH